jgi:CBS domain-containing protein
MWLHDIGAVPVVDDTGFPVAMITDRDIAMCLLLTGGSAGQTTVERAMSKRLICVRPDQTVSEAESLMRESQIRRLPVVDGSGRLAGVITLGDVARMVGATGVARTFSAISTPRSQMPRATA